MPYRDFAVEYPPLALPVFAAPSLFGGGYAAYEPRFEVLMGLAGAATAALAVLVLSRFGVPSWRLALAALFATVVPLVAPVLVLSRYDLWPALLVIGALAALLAGRDRLAFGVLGLAVAAKVYPVVILPIAASFVWRRAGRRQALVCIAVCIATVALCFAPFALAAPNGLWQSIHEQAARPLQLETLGASLMLASHQLLGSHLALLVSHHSYNLGGGTAAGLASILGVVQIVALLAVWLLFAAGPSTRQRLLIASAASVCTFIVFNRVLSPQYLLWLVPLVIALPGRRGVVGLLLLAASLLVTRLWYPFHVPPLEHFATRESWLVIIRNGLLLALLGTLLWPELYRLMASRASRAPTLSSGPAPSLSAPALIDGRP